MMTYKMQNCLVDVPQLPIKDIVDKTSDAVKSPAVDATQDPARAFMAKSLEKLLVFDKVGDDLVKFSTKCENLILSGSVTSMFKKK
jgi:hypothetical protein